MIKDMHQACLYFLLECQSNDDTLFFVPRKINNKNRLEEGMYFRGNDNYLTLTFWDNADTKEYIYNINWSCDSKGISYIDLSCRDNPDLRPHIEKIISLIKKNDSQKLFDETKPNRWRFRYPEEEHYLNTLQDFILNEKPLIDNYLKQHPESGIPLANEETNEKYVKTLPCFSKYTENIKKKKQTGTITVKTSEYIMHLQHNELSNNLTDYLINNGYKDVNPEVDYVDITCIDPDGKKIFFELKTAKSVKFAIREAIGQLLEYNHYPNTNKADKLIIVTKEKPNKDDASYLKELRSRYNIPVYYKYFDIDKKMLSAEY